MVLIKGRIDLQISHLLDHEELHIEYERCIAGDWSSTPGPIAKVTGDGELGSLAFGHLRYALLPALNDLLLAQREHEGTAAVSGAVDLLAALQGEDVVAGDLLALLREGNAVPRLHSLNLNSHDDLR